MGKNEIASLLLLVTQLLEENMQNTKDESLELFFEYNEVGMY